MLNKLLCSIVEGVEGKIIGVEVDIADKSVPYFAMVGLADLAIKEAKERVSSALKNNGFTFPLGKIVINLTPAYIKKEGTYFDLSIALGIILSSHQTFTTINLEEYIFLGELSLDGRLFPLKGILPMVIGAKKEGIKKIVVPFENRKEAGIVDGVEIFGAKNLLEVINHVNGLNPIKAYEGEMRKKNEREYGIDFSDVKGQEGVKRAMEIAAAGAHNLLMVGPPGSGKTMLAKRFPTILPDMTLEESLEVTKIYSVCGLLSNDTPLITTRPFRNPHHTISSASLVGGGKFPKPGEVSLSHLGALFLDEFTEFQKYSLEALRQPIEDRRVTISRVSGTLTFPASFILLASMNPCPCGFLGDDKHECTCSEAAIERYKQKISGPMLDRIDLTVEVPSQDYEKLRLNGSRSESSSEIRKRVNKAREIQLRRYSNKKVYFNSNLNSTQMEEVCVLGKEEEKIISMAFYKLNLSARSYHKILKISRTIADLEESKDIKANHIMEALQYRGYNSK